MVRCPGLLELAAVLLRANVDPNAVGVGRARRLDRRSSRCRTSRCSRGVLTGMDTVLPSGRRMFSESPERTAGGRSLRCAIRRA